MSPEWLALLGLAVAISAFAYDFAVTMYNRAVREADSEDPDVAADAATRAGRWSIAIYAVGLVGMLGVLKISLWLVFPEAIGFYYGTKCGALWRRRK